MSNRPTFTNNNTQMECIRNQSGEPIKLKLVSWINPKKDHKFDADKLKVCDEIRDLVYKHDLIFNVQFKEPIDDDYKTPYEPPKDDDDAPAAPSGGGGFGGRFNNG